MPTIILFLPTSRGHLRRTLVIVLLLALVVAGCTTPAAETPVERRKPISVRWFSAAPDGTISAIDMGVDGFMGAETRSTLEPSTAAGGDGHAGFGSWAYGSEYRWTLKAGPSWG